MKRKEFEQQVNEALVEGFKQVNIHEMGFKRRQLPTELHHTGIGLGIPVFILPDGSSPIGVPTTNPEPKLRPGHPGVQISTNFNMTPEQQAIVNEYGQKLLDALSKTF